MCGLLLAAGLAIGYWSGWFAKRLSPDEHPENATTTTTNSQPLISPTKPEWMSARTAQLLTELSSIEPFSELGATIRSEAHEARRSAYQRLAVICCQQDLANRKRVEDLICQLFFEEPDDSLAFAITDRVYQLTRLSDEEFDVTRSRFQTQIRANRLLALIYYATASTVESGSNLIQRRQQLSLQIRSASGVSPEGLLFVEYIQESEQGLAIDQWNYLINHCWASPGRAASVVQTLYDLTEPRMPEGSLRKYRIRILESILKLDVRQWQSLQRPIRDTISTCDEVELMEWIDLYANTGDEDFAQFVGPLLLRKADLADRSPPTRTRELLTEFSLRYRNRVLQPLLSRNQRVALRTDEFLEGLDASDRSVTADLVAQVVFETNLNLAICQQIRRGTLTSPEDFSQLDDWLTQPKIRLRDLISIAGNSQNGQASVQPSAYEVNRKDAAISNLRDRSPELASKRVLALEQLQQVASRFDDIPTADATELADYLLTDWPDVEALNIQRRISSFARWPTLGLAIADRIGAGGIKMDQALTISRLFFGGEFGIETGDDEWPGSLQHQLLISTRRLIESRMAENPGGVDSDWDRLEALLNELYRVRHQLLFSDEGNSVFTSDFDSNDRPLDIVRATLQRFTTDQRLSPDLQQRIQRGNAMLRRGSHSELEQVIIANQLILEALTGLVEAEAPAASDEIPQLTRQTESLFADSQLISDQLFVIQLGLLRLSSRWRQAMVENLLSKK